MRLIIVSVFLLLITAPVAGQNITGTWKRISSTLEYQDGKKEDLHKAVLAGFPCARDMQFIFKADGTHYSQSSKGCETINAMSKATWKQTGNTLTLVSVKETEANPGGTRYTLTFSGNTVTLTHIYTEAENKGVGIKVKKLVLVYQRI
jgi:hypothetical protein